MQSARTKRQSRQPFLKEFPTSKSLTLKQIKERTKHSFERHILDNASFNSYIESMYEQMLKEKSDNPTLIVPRGFKSFIESPLFKEFLKQIYEYMCLYMNCCSQRTLIGQNAGMLYETSLLKSKCKQMSFVYMGILLTHGECKFIFRDQYFFETMIYFISQILKANFEEQEFILVDEELNRIFRTDTFNLIKRRRQEDKMLQKFPDLKQTKYEATSSGADRLIKRISIHKRLHLSTGKNSMTAALSKSLSKGKGVTRPMDIRQSTHKSLYSRSPLIGLRYPGSKEIIFDFNAKPIY